MEMICKNANSWIYYDPVSQTILKEYIMLKRVPFKIQDLHKNEYELLKQSYFLHYNNPEHFVCFGRYYSKLYELDLIDKENQITYVGRQLVKFLMARMD